jgi:hypothetical protein
MITGMLSTGGSVSGTGAGGLGDFGKRYDGRMMLSEGGMKDRCVCGLKGIWGLPSVFVFKGYHDGEVAGSVYKTV